MIEPISVLVEPSEALDRTVRATLASLPRSYRRIDARGADAPVLATAGELGWAGRAREAIAAGALGVLVSEPMADDPEDVLALAEAATAAGVPVRLAEQWAANPAVEAFAAEVDPSAESVLVESRAIVAGGEPTDLLAAQLRLVVSALDGAATLDAVALSDIGYVIKGRIDRAGVLVPLLLSGAISTAVTARASVRELTHHGRRAIEVHAAASARPATASIGDRLGERRLPAHHETGHRAAWRRLREDIAARTVVATELEAFSAAARIARGVRGGAGA